MDNRKVYTEYNDEKNRIPWLRMIITAFVMALIIFVILLLLKNCKKTSLRGDLVDAAESYYEKYPTSLPKEVGECYVLTLSTLEKEGLVDTNKYSTCDKTKTYVNVCYLENLKYNYSATLSCKVETTNYEMWKDGNVSDLVEGSDVRFMFTGEQYTLAPEDTENATKYYYPTNTTNVDEVSNYYASAPAEGYNNNEGETTGYKWYTQSTVKSYWNNGTYSATAPNGYIYKDSEKITTSYSDTKPESASYRTINEVTLYRYRKIASPYRYICVPANATNTDIAITSPYHCGLNDQGFTKVWEVHYSCDGGLTTTNKFDTICSDYTEWSKESCTTNYSKGIECESKQGYEYTDTMYKWYKNINVRSYYPSKSYSASGENTYFVTSPVSGAIRDDSTSSQVYKFYKTDSEMVEKWVEVTDGYVTLDELISTFNNLGYQVNSLSDIKALENIRYNFKMQYRNIEE